MDMRFDPATCALLFAPEFLSVFPARGRAFTDKALGLRFHGISDCLCLGKRTQVILPVTGDGRLPCALRESCPYPANEAALAKIAARQFATGAPVVELDEAAPFFPPGAENFWHWTTESLPKILALEKTGYQGPYILPQQGKTARESLAMHGIAAERILFSGPIYKIKRLILAPRLSGFALAENMPLTAFLRASLLEAAGELPGSRRLYIRRIGTRKVANEAPLLELLDEFGFTVMTPEDLPLAEQWRQMTNCACTVMAHGANATLTLLQPPGSGCIEFFGNRYSSYTNLHAARLLKLRYHALVQEMDLSSVPDTTISADEFVRAGQTADILVDLLYTRIMLENLLP